MSKKTIRIGSAWPCLWAALLLLAVLGCTTTPDGPGFKAFKSGDYENARVELLPLAQLGNADAQLRLGLMYRDGMGVPPDYVEAMKWFRKAAEQNLIEAQMALALIYMDRQTVYQDDVQALMWLNLAAMLGSDEAMDYREGLMTRMTPSQIVKAQQLGKDFKPENEFRKILLELKPLAEGGDDQAQLKVGTMHYKGQGTPKNFPEAYRWYRLAADKGNAYAMANLGYLYEKGEGVPQNHAEAVRWYVLAAEKGNARAQYNLGYLYEKGQGAPQSDVQALKWYTLSAIGGNAQAVNERERLIGWMTPAQVLEAQRLAAEFQAATKK